MILPKLHISGGDGDNDNDREGDGCDSVQTIDSSYIFTATFRLETLFFWARVIPYMGFRSCFHSINERKKKKILHP